MYFVVQYVDMVIFPHSNAISVSFWPQIRVINLKTIYRDVVGGYFYPIRFACLGNFHLCAPSVDRLEDDVVVWRTRSGNDDLLSICTVAYEDCVAWCDFGNSKLNCAPGL